MPFIRVLSSDAVRAWSKRLNAKQLEERGNEMTDQVEERKEDKRPEYSGEAVLSQVRDQWDREEIFNYKHLLRESAHNSSEASLPNVRVVGDDNKENSPKADLREDEGTEPKDKPTQRNPKPRPQQHRQWQEIIQTILDVFPDLAK
jgi:hypothetical protein